METLKKGFKLNGEINRKEFTNMTADWEDKK